MAELHHLIPIELEKQFHNVIETKKRRMNESTEEKLERVSLKLGIEKHGKGKRKKRKNKKKKGGNK